ncbi:hypothetical protein BWU74_18155 [Paraburkholderia caledonica]|nr:hypothetical protein BWU74_18155 [Burkholderia sp. Bk]
MQGLQIWNASGFPILDSSDRLGRIVGMAPVQGFNASVSADLSQGTPFYSFQPDFLFKHVNQVTPPPMFTINAGGITWVYDTDGGTNYRYPVTGLVFFGVF